VRFSPNPIRLVPFPPPIGFHCISLMAKFCLGINTRPATADKSYRMNGKLKVLIILLVLVSGIRLLIAAWDWFDRSPRIPAAAKAQAQVNKIQIEKPFLEISPEARARLLYKLKGIKIEDTVEHVLEELGNPHSDPSAISPTENIPITVASRILIYQIRKQKPDSFDELNDEHIYIFLDGNETVAYVYTKIRQP
jgi:hypothetical protein